MDNSDSCSSDDEELALLVLLNRSSTQCRPDRFNFNQPASAAVWKSKFCFEKDDIIALVKDFELPDPFPTPQRYQVSALEVLCIFLRRMAYPARLEDLEDLFGRDSTAISSISDGVLDFLYQSFSHLLLFDDRRLTDGTLSAYATAIYKKGAPLRTCVRFIGGTVRGMCRPKKNQKYVYNGHKRKHALKYQSVLAPDGIIIHLSEPFPGTRHDAFILQQSRLLEVESPALTIDGRHYVFYGHPAYGQQNHLVAPFKGASLTSDEQEFNK
ncbi:hypothetical protein PR003_g20869 [Phytophthora rubi]|uniref:DDE Tnp4 domain-containing protein n=1 Tax=Phytophthora rubi TaxID=129364 RepID=A0A6A4DIY0_9STRA|nr:hypothetical protein PR002_g20143 [Phytophthora rubi]KAE8995721.1 hypothetical protein PR001_g20057 [Phytophthora rubi]KAE9307943.1 hypothetical protein PR003_g20869 [Phytophthora rubi]